MKNISVKLTVLLVLILFVSLKASAAYISFAFTNSLGAPITNDFRLVKVGDTLSDGSVIPQGLPIRVTPSSDGRATNRLQTGNWYATNSYLSQAIRFRVPQDDGPTVYFFTDPGIWVSGGSYFVTQVIGGSNAAPTYNQVTNALGYLPLTQSKLDDTNSALIARIIATNSLNMAATVTNIGGAATNLTVKASGGAGSKAISAKDVIGAEQMFVDDEGLWLPQMISSSGLQLVGINDSGLLSKFTGTLTNNTSGNSSLATNSINATNIYGSGLVAMTNAATQVSTGATNGLNSALVTRITLATNALAAVVAFNLNSASNVLRQATINSTNDLNAALATRIQNSTNDLNTALVAADTVVSNGLSARIVATNAALATRMDDATNSLNTTLSTRITNATNSLNSALVTRIQNATNDLNTALVAANTVISNGLSSRLIATNAALISADTVVSNGLSARLIATNTSLQGQILNATNGLNSALATRITDATNSLNSALVTAGTAISNGLSSRLIATNVALLANDTTVSNGLSARIIATNSLLTTRITDATNSLNTVLMSQISATTNDYKVRVIAAGTNITVLTNATAGIYTVSGSFDSNSVYAIGLQAAYTVGGATGGVTVATANTLAQTNIAWRVPNMLLSGTNLFPGAAVTGTLTNNTTGNASDVSSSANIALSRYQTNQWQRLTPAGIPRNFGGVITNDEGNPYFPNNGYGSIDLQSPYLAVYDVSPTNWQTFTNDSSCGGVYCVIAGGYGNKIFQTQEAANISSSFFTYGCSIGGGAYNSIMDGSDCHIGGGSSNIITAAGAGFADDSFIGYGILCYVAATDAAIGYGWLSTNTSPNGTLVNGERCWLDGTGIHIGGGHFNWIRGTSDRATIASGYANVISNAVDSHIITGKSNFIVEANHSFALGVNVSNRTHYAMDFGYGADKLRITPTNITAMGKTIFQGSGNLLTNITGLGYTNSLTISPNNVQTNRSRWTIVANNPFENTDTPYTNRNQQATVQFQVTFSGVLDNDGAFAYLLCDQDADGTYEDNFNYVGASWLSIANATYPTIQISADLQPNARFMLAITNTGVLGQGVISGSRITYK